MRKHTCMHALCANIHKAHTRIQYVCVNECWPGVPLGGNYSARRGSILTASCFLSLSLSLWPLAPSLKNMTALLPYSACVCLCSHVSLHVCVLPTAFDSFIPCLFNSQPTRSIDVCVCRCVGVYLPVCLHYVPLCVFSLWFVWLLTCL